MKNVAFVLLALFTLGSFTGCTQKSESKKMPEVSAEMDLVKAKQTLVTACYVCHSPTAPENSRLAPPMEAVKRRYLMVYPDKADFVDKVSHFVANANEDEAIMYGAIDQFNVMLPLPYPEEDLRAIATYIYENELEYPDWFDAHFEQNHGAGNGQGGGMGNGMQRRNRLGQGGNN